MRNIGSVDVDGWGRVTILAGRYPAGGAICVQLMSSDGEPVATFSTNLRAYGHEISDDEFHVRGWEENAQFVEPMLRTGLFESTGRSSPTGYVVAPIWRVKSADLVPVARG